MAMGFYKSRLMGAYDRRDRDFVAAAERQLYTNPATMRDADGNELVAELDACPDCGERRIDALVWTEVDGGGWIIECQSCGRQYAGAHGPA
jgi:hypothetical protein